MSEVQMWAIKCPECHEYVLELGPGSAVVCECSCGAHLFLAVNQEGRIERREVLEGG